MATKSFQFKILASDKKTKARVGEIITPRGKIQTPAFVPVGTAATVKSLTPEEIAACKIEVFFVNTYHMIFRPGVAVVGKLGGLHKFMNWQGPLMTDSGGFQAFSLGELGRQTSGDLQELTKIKEAGIYFKSVWEGKEVFLGPRESITFQQKLGSDIMMAFDECTFYPIKETRAKKAMERTHRWALECLERKKKGRKNQALYGVVQGSVFKDLREESAKFISSLPFEGFAIGSVANSGEPRHFYFSVLSWTTPYLLEKQKPIHFLGVGEVADIFESIPYGVDSFDCVIPTRLARMGWIFNKKVGLKNRFRYSITKASFSLSKEPLEKGCPCFTCQNFSRAYINHLFRSRELLAYRLVTIHNLYFYGSLMENIRESIAEGDFKRLKNSWFNS